MTLLSESVVLMRCWLSDRDRVECGGVSLAGVRGASSGVKLDLHTRTPGRGQAHEVCAKATLWECKGIAMPIGKSAAQSERVRATGQHISAAENEIRMRTRGSA